MAPTIQPRGFNSNSVNTRNFPRRPNEEKRSDLVCRVKYCNTLPDIPFDPKFIAYPFERTRFYDYNPTSLEGNYKYELLTEHDLGVAVDLVLPDAYQQEDGEESMLLDAKDERLLEEDAIGGSGNLKRSQQHAKILSWMRRPDYISTEQTRYQPTTIEKIESRIGFGVRKKLGGAEMATYMDREAQISSIEKTFEDSRVPIEHHYSKKGVTPVEILPLLPDAEMWRFPCAQVIFDSDPVLQIGDVGIGPAEQTEIMSQAMIRGVMDESGEQFVAYFLPTRKAIEKRRADVKAGIDFEEEEEYEYRMAREYNWNVKSKSTKGYEENFFFIIRNNSVCYNELETRVRLSKRRLKAGQHASNSKLVVTHRPLNKQEHKMQRYRERNLQPAGEEDEISDDDEEDDELPDTSEQIVSPRSGSLKSSSSVSSNSRSRSITPSRSNVSPRSTNTRSVVSSGSNSRSGSSSPISSQDSLHSDDANQ